MATNIPPHNLGEAIDAVVHLLDNPDATPDDLMEFVKGPYFPTGASILGKAGIIDADPRTGARSVKMRATVEIEEAKNGRMERSWSPNWPYQTSCSAPLPSRIQDLVDGGDLDGIADVNDASSGGKTNLDHHRPQARCERERRQEQPVQAHPAAVDVLDQHGRPRRRRAPPDQPRATAVVAYVKHQRRRHHPSFAVPSRQGHSAASTSSKGRIKALDVIDADHRPDPCERRRRRRTRGPDGRTDEFSEMQANDILDMQPA